MKYHGQGFTLVELMVTIGIIGILSAIVYANIGSANPKARDADRQANLRNLQSAIELYKQKNGRYPDMGTDVNNDNMSSESEGDSIYVVNLAPEFIAKLPKDVKRGTNFGYTYVTNTSGTSFKIMALGTVESEDVSVSHSLKRCDNSIANICPVSGVCSPVTVDYKKTYALWGGFADGDSEATVKTETAKVICK